MADIQEELQFELQKQAYWSSAKGNIQEVQNVLNNPEFRIDGVLFKDAYSLLDGAMKSEEIFDLLLAQEKLDINASNPVNSILNKAVALTMDRYSRSEDKNYPLQSVYNNVLKLMNDKRLQLQDDDTSKKLIKVLNYCQNNIKNDYLSRELRPFFPEKIKAYKYGLMSNDKAAKTLNMSYLGEQELAKNIEQLESLRRELREVEQQIKAEETKNKTNTSKKNIDFDDFDFDDNDSNDNLYQTEKEKTKALANLEKHVKSFADDLKLLKSIEEITKLYWEKKPVHWERLDELKELLPDSDIKKMFNLNNQAEYMWTLPDNMKQSHLETALDYILLSDQQYEGFKKFSVTEQKLLLNRNIKAYESNVTPVTSLFLVSKENDFDFDKPNLRNRNFHSENESILNDIHTVVEYGNRPDFETLDFVLNHTTKMDTRMLLDKLEIDRKYKSYDKMLTEIALHPAFDYNKLNAYEIEVLKRDERTASQVESLKPDINAKKNNYNFALMCAVDAGDIKAFGALLKNPELNLLSDTMTLDRIREEEEKNLHVSYGANFRSNYTDRGYADLMVKEIKSRKKALTNDTVIFSENEAQKLPAEERSRILQLPKLFQHKLKYGYNTPERSEYITAFEKAAEMVQHYGSEAHFSAHSLFGTFEINTDKFWDSKDKKQMSDRLSSLSAEEIKKKLPINAAHPRNQPLAVDYALELIEHLHLTGELETGADKTQKVEEIKRKIRQRQEQDPENAYLVKKDGTVKTYPRNLKDIEADMVLKQASGKQKFDK